MTEPPVVALIDTEAARFAKALADLPVILRPMWRQRPRRAGPCHHCLRPSRAGHAPRGLSSGHASPALGSEHLGGVNPLLPLLPSRPELQVSALKGPFGALMVRYLNFWLDGFEQGFWLRWQLSARPAGPTARSVARALGTRAPELWCWAPGPLARTWGQRSARGYHAIGLNRSGTRVPSFAEVYPIARRREALAEAEVVVSVVPATAETAGLLDEEALAALAPGALLMNVGRGSVVKEAALLAALESGHLGAAVLDVFDAEPLPDDHALWAACPVLCDAPYLGAHGLGSGGAGVSREFAQGAGGEPPTGLVDPGRGY